MTKQIAGSFLGTLAAGALIMVGAKVLGPIPLSISQTTTNKQSTFDVTGEGSVTSAPDRAEISIGVTKNESTVQAAQQKGNEAINKITQELTGLGVAKEDIKTINYSLYPNMDYQQGQKITGYSLNVTLQVKTKDFDKVNQIIDVATRNGANQIGGVSFVLSEDKQRDLENQVREQAISNAKTKADSVSKIAGVKLGKIVNVIENNNNNYPRPVMMAKTDSAVGMGGGVGAPTEIQPGSTTFTMTVTLSYETL